MSLSLVFSSVHLILSQGFMSSSLSHVELCWKMHPISIFLKPGLNPGNTVPAFYALVLSDGGFIL